RGGGAVPGGLEARVARDDALEGARRRHLHDVVLVVDELGGGEEERRGEAVRGSERRLGDRVAEPLREPRPGLDAREERQPRLHGALLLLGPLAVAEPDERTFEELHEELRDPRRRGVGAARGLARSRGERALEVAARERLVDGAERDAPRERGLGPLR